MVHFAVKLLSGIDAPFFSEFFFISHNLHNITELLSLNLGESPPLDFVAYKLLFREQIQTPVALTDSNAYFLFEI